jgi:hypothetical protein
MAVWTVRTYYKKSVEEHEHFVKDGKEITRKTGWRTGSWTVTTTDDNPPEFEYDFVPGGDGRKDSIDMNNCYNNNIENVELIETWDGCWEDIDFPDDMPEEEKDRLMELIEEEGFYALEDQEDWYSSDTECWIWGPIEIVNEQEETVRIIIADEHGNITDFKEDE